MALVDQSERFRARKKAAKAGKLVCFDCGTSEGGIRVMNGNGNMVCLDCGGKASRPFSSDVDVYEAEDEGDED